MYPWFNRNRQGLGLTLSLETKEGPHYLCCLYFDFSKKNESSRCNYIWNRKYLLQFRRVKSKSQSLWYPKRVLLCRLLTWCLMIMISLQVNWMSFIPFTDKERATITLLTLKTFKDNHCCRGGFPMLCGSSSHTQPFTDVTKASIHTDKSVTPTQIIKNFKVTHELHISYRNACKIKQKSDEWRHIESTWLVYKFWTLWLEG